MLPFQLMLAATLLAMGFNRTFPVAGTGAFPTLLLLPVGKAEMNGGLPVSFALNFKAFMADPDIQPAPLIGSVLHLCPPLTPNADILSFVMLPVLPPAKAVLPNSAGWHDDVDVGIIPQPIFCVLPSVDGGNRAQDTKFCSMNSWTIRTSSPGGSSLGRDAIN